MAKKLDLNQLAKSIVDQATGDKEKQEKKKEGKGVKGGISRMNNMKKDEKSDFGRLGAAKRWGKTD